MASLFSILGVARDGIIAQTGAVSATGQNIANVNTPGYVRREPRLEARRTSGEGALGGVDYTGVRRVIDRFAFGRVIGEQGARGNADALAHTLADLEGIVAPETGSIASRLDSFFGALARWTGGPADPTSRAAVVAASEQLSYAVISTARAIEQSREDLVMRADGVADVINARTREIAALNREIASADAAGVPAPDLRDRRDVLLRDVADRIGARAVEDEHGAITVFSAGAVLVEADHAAEVQVDLDARGDLRVRFSRSGVVEDVSTRVVEGELGGVREARDTDYARARDALDGLAEAFSNAVNAVHEAGVGLDGVSGRPLFARPTARAGAAIRMVVDAGVRADPRRLAAATSAADLPSGNDNALALTALANAPLAGSGSPSAAFAELVGDVGLARRNAEDAAALRADTLAQAEELHSSASAVSLDEEMVALTKYQRAFEAATKVLRTVDELLAGLMRDL